MEIELNTLNNLPIERLNLNVANFAYKCKKVGTTSKTRPTICISLTIEGKTQVGWGFVVGKKTQKCVKNK